MEWYLWLLEPTTCFWREYGSKCTKSLVVCRHIDRSIAVPLQMSEFNLFLKAAGRPVGPMMLWRRLRDTVAMLAMIAAAVSFFAQDVRVTNRWKTSSP